MKKSNGERTYAILESGKTYKFAGYSWTACEVNNDGHVAVIQSRGVTHGAWPGFKMTEFDSKYSIDGYDISAYDVKTKKLYDAIKDVEDKSASYGKGLYLVSKEKAGFTEWGEPGSGDYWQALKKQRETPVRSGLPTTVRGLVLSTVAATRGVSTRVATSATTAVRATTMWSPPLSILTYQRLRLLGMRLSSKGVTITISLRTNQIQSHIAPFGNMVWILPGMARHFISIRRW